MPGLDVAITEILEAITDAETDAATSGGELDGITVVTGDRARPMPELPAVWMIPEPAQASQAEYGDPEAWTLPIRFVAMAKDDQVVTGQAQARAIAAAARRVAMRPRRLGLDYVVDTRSLSFDPTAPPPENKRNLFRADARIAVDFTVDEDDS